MAWHDARPGHPSPGGLRALADLINEALAAMGTQPAVAGPMFSSALESTPAMVHKPSPVRGRTSRNMRPPAPAPEPEPDSAPPTSADETDADAGLDAGVDETHVETWRLVRAGPERRRRGVRPALRPLRRHRLPLRLLPHQRPRAGRGLHQRDVPAGPAPDRHHQLPGPRHRGLVHHHRPQHRARPSEVGPPPPRAHHRRHHRGQGAGREHRIRRPRRCCSPSA